MNHVLAETSAEEGYALIDRNTPVRAVVGVSAGVVGVPVWLVTLGLIAFEASKTGWFRSRRETPANRAMDVAVTVGGYYFGRWLRARMTQLTPVP